MADEHIRVEVVRSGGFAGLTRTGRVDTADLDEDRARTLRDLLSATTFADPAARPRAASPQAARGADRFQYDVTLVRGDERRSFVVHEADLSEADQRLVRWVLTEGRSTG